MRNWTIRTKLLLGFGAVILVTVSVSLYAVERLRSIQERSDELARNELPGLYYMSKIASGSSQDKPLVLEYLSTDDPARRGQIEQALQTTRQEVHKFLERYQTTAFGDAELQRFKALTDAYATYLNETDALLRSQRDTPGKNGSERYRSDFAPIFQKLNAAIDDELQYNKDGSDSAVQELSASERASIVALGSGIACSFIFAVIVCYFVVQSINRPLSTIMQLLTQVRSGDFTRRLKLTAKDEMGSLADGFNRMSDDLAGLVGQVQRTALQITTSVTEIAATSKQQQATTTQVASATSEIGATSKEIAATAKELLRTINEVTSVAEQTANLAGSGQTGLNRMELTMRQVMAAGEAISAKLSVLNEKTVNINQIVTTITKVADQTNLLSLNAAIEAEKAGEHGKGFSVVATEIRHLADQTGVATYDIEQIVKEMQAAVSAGVMGMEKFSEEVRGAGQDIARVSEQLVQIIRQVQVLTPQFETVNEGMQAQTVGAEQISEALIQLIESTQQTAESLRQSTLVIDELNTTANDLRTGVSRFKLQMA